MEDFKSTPIDKKIHAEGANDTLTPLLEHAHIRSRIILETRRA